MNKISHEEARNVLVSEREIVWNRKEFANDYISQQKAKDKAHDEFKANVKRYLILVHKLFHFTASDEEIAECQKLEQELKGSENSE